MSIHYDKEVMKVKCVTYIPHTIQSLKKKPIVLITSKIYTYIYIYIYI